VSDQNFYLSAANALRENEGQWAAYESTGHCVVLAGPGSGKTKTLTVKLARMLCEDVQEPRGLACITYNNECARELENRLEALGIEAGRRVFIGTVHSFSLTQIILPYHKVACLDLPEDFSVATPQEQAGALEKAYHDTVGGPDNPQHWKLPLGNYRRSILDRNSDKWRKTDPQLAQLVEAYEAELRAIGCIDFDDMPLLALRALRRHAWLRKAILAKYPILAVDEYQDLGIALHQMVMGLCIHGGCRLFAVGDPDQSIYGFTGARPELLRKLAEREDVDTVQLELNYRCGSEIVRASSFALGEERAFRAPEGADQGSIFFHRKLGDLSQQARYLFNTLLPELRDRIPDLDLGNIAILYPAAWIGDEIAGEAQRQNISFIRTDGNALYPRGSRLMRWLEGCAQWCAGGWQSGNPRFSRIVNEAQRLFAEALTTDEARQDFQRKLIGFLWPKRKTGLNLHEWLVELETELLDSIKHKCLSVRDEIDIFQKFLTKTAEGNECADMLLGQFAGMQGTDCLNLSTLHSSKGREFSAVVMFGIDRGKIPRNTANTREIIEARRLFYVGFTRAKTELHIMYSAGSPSPLVTELRNRLEENLK
jgi:superfamily I DNA/RNA helicase